MADVPFEIQREIIKWFPVKSLFQFRSVSKSWKSLIDSSQFIADYNACESRPQRLLIQYEDHPYTREYKYVSDPKYVYIVDDDIFPQHKFATTFPISVEHLHELIPVGSSQGLLCLLGAYGSHDSYGEIAFIWNPAIRKSIAIDLPVPHQMLKNILGFGVCPNTNEPMLVKINDYDEKSWPVALFTLSSRVWRRPRSNLPHKSDIFTGSQVAIDGFIYWQTYNGLIVSFDMTTEEFAEINLPFAYSRIMKDYSISKLNESLAVLGHYKVKEKQVCTVWMMEHGFPKSFTKLFTVTTPTNAYFMKVLGFRKNGEVILEAKTDDYKQPSVLGVHEPHTKYIKDIGVYGKLYTFFMRSYTETLLLLEQADTYRVQIAEFITVSLSNAKWYLMVDYYYFGFVEIPSSRGLL